MVAKLDLEAIWIVKSWNILFLTHLLYGYNQAFIKMHVHMRICVEPTHGFRVRWQNTIFYQISSQIWPLTPTGRSQFLINIKNAFTSLIVESSCLFVPSFVHIVIAGSEWQAKTWFWGEIRSNFDLWPHQSKTNLWAIKKCRYRLVLMVKLSHSANFCAHRM